MTPVRFRPRASLRIEIEVPRRGPVAVQAVVWHERPFRQPSSGRRGWATGLVLAQAGPDFLALTQPGALGGSARKDEVLAALRGASRSGMLGAAIEETLAPAPRPTRRRSTAKDPDEILELLEGGQSLYRVRLKAVGSTRTRVLTLRAVSEAAVCEAVLRDLDGDWEVLGVEVDPID